MKKFLFLLAFMPLVLGGCNGDEPSEQDLSVAWNTYEKIYEDNQVWELVFTDDSLHTYWKGDLEMSASYIQDGANVNCISSKGNEFVIIAGKGYVIYSDQTFTKRQ